MRRVVVFASAACDSGKILRFFVFVCIHKSGFLLGFAGKFVLCMTLRLLIPLYSGF